MILRFFLLFYFSGIVFCTAQDEGFQLINNIDKLEIPFQVHGNQIIIPVEVNGVELNFSVDSGSARSIIFDFNGIDSLNIKKGKLLKFTGYGEKEYFQAYHSDNNSLRIANNYVNENAELLIMMDEEFSISERIGYPVNGLLGKDFFNSNLVHIDNENLKITIFKHDVKLPRKIRNLKPYSFEMIKDKPHLKTKLSNNNSSIEITTMLDTGSSDALLLFNVDNQFQEPEEGFRDYLGYGMNGKVFGKRSKIDLLELWDEKIRKVTVSIPDLTSLSKDKKLSKNFGSIGMEIIRRFNLTFDYKNKLLYVNSLHSLNEGFYYNMTGMTVIRDGYEIKAELKEATSENAQGFYKNHDGQITVNLYKKLEYNKIPKIIVENVTKGSVAYQNGILPGDQIIKANRYMKSNLSLQLLSDLFHSNPYSKLKLTLLRDGVELKKELFLVPLIE